MSSVQSKKSASAQNPNVDVNPNTQSTKGNQTMKTTARNVTVSSNNTKTSKGNPTMSTQSKAKSAKTQNPKGNQTVSAQPQAPATRSTAAQATGTPATTPQTPTNWTQYVAATTAALQGATTGLGVTGAPAGQAKNKMAKARKGFETLAPQVANLLAQYDLVTSALPVQTMLDDLTNVQTLAPLVTLVENYAKALEGVVFANNTESYSIMLDGYHSLKRLAKTNGALAAALQPVSEFFAYRHTSVKAAKPTKPAAKTDAKLKKVAKTVAARGARGTQAAQTASTTLAGVAQTVSTASATPPAAAPANGAPPPAATVAPAANGAASAHA